MTVDDATPRLIGLDWGTSALRAYLIGSSGRILARTAQPSGVMTVRDERFAATFDAVVHAWDTAYPGLPAIAAGMVGSSEGWVHAPYCPCPAGVEELGAALVVVPVDRLGSLHVVPGVELRGPRPDVMRGEETQIAGALWSDANLRAASTIVLPGTHAKWVSVRASRIVSFQTYLTGELYALLAEHSILGRPARAARERGHDVDPGTAAHAFSDGVRAAIESGERGVMPLLFRVRSRVLAGTLAPEASLEMLSGMLVGEELRSARAASHERLTLIGEATLCERYRRAFAEFGVTDVATPPDTAAVGLWRIACSAGLIPESTAGARA